MPVRWAFVFDRLRMGMAGRKADVWDIFHGWHSPIPEVIEATPGAEILRNDIVDRLPTADWGRAG